MMATEFWLRDRECLKQLLNDKGALSLKKTRGCHASRHITAANFETLFGSVHPHCTTRSTVHRLRPLVSHFVARMGAVATRVSESCNFVNKATLAHKLSWYVYFFSLHVSGDCVPIIR